MKYGMQFVTITTNRKLVRTLHTFENKAQQIQWNRGLSLEKSGDILKNLVKCAAPTIIRELSWGKHLVHFFHTVYGTITEVCRDYAAPSFTFPEPPDMLDVDISDIVSQVNPTTATGRTYTLTKQEMTEATCILAKRLHS